MRRYLAEFLSDPRVVKLPRFLWLPILYGIVLRRRPAESAEKYASIWTPEGSPLAVYTARQTDALRRRLGIPVEYAMRYGEPAIAAALERLPRDGVVVVPLYPQYSESTTQSVADKLPPGLAMVHDFHAHPAYIAACAAQLRRHWERNGRGELLVLSFHGLPRRGGAAYEAQCRTSAGLLQQALGMPETLVTFQSRFGYAEWLQPYTEPTLVALAAAGKRRVDVFCPGFVADCLETLEEIGIGARRAFRAAGGEDLYVVPCLNDSPAWLAALAEIAGGCAA